MEYALSKAVFSLELAFFIEKVALYMAVLPTTAGPIR
jgi:hypothetical protein